VTSVDRKERFDNLQLALITALVGFQSTIWTAIPCIIQSFNPLQQTCVAQPSIQAQVRDTEGNFTWVNLPLLLDVPVYFPSGGGYTLTFPVNQGDECLVVFASRCIDSWWQSGGIGVQADQRMHDLSDGFAFVGVKSLPNNIPNISTTGVQLRSNTGLTSVDITGGTITLTAPTLVLINAPSVEFTGNVKVDGVLTAQDGVTTTGGSFTDNGKNVGSTHTHSGVSTGSGNTGPPV
jgi:hypothetical protein